MASRYAIRRTPLAPEDPRLDAVPMATAIVVPFDCYTWEHLLGIRGFSAIWRTVRGDTIAVAAEAELAGDRFVCVVAMDEESDEQRRYVLATRGGRVRAHLDLDATGFFRDVFERYFRLVTAGGNPDDSAGLNLLNMWNGVDNIFFVRLAPFGDRLLLALCEITVLLDPETLAVVAASGAGAATVDTSSAIVSCVAIENSPPGVHRLVRLGPDLGVLARGDDVLSLDYVSVDAPQVAGFVSFALTARGRVVAVCKHHEQGDWALRIFEPDFREVHAEPIGAQDVELVGAGGHVFLRSLEGGETPEQGHWLLEVLEDGRLDCANPDDAESAERM